MDSLHFSQLYHACDPASFSFETTSELEPLTGLLGQKNALSAIDFGSNIRQDGFNLFAMGPSGSGKHSVIMEYLEKKAADEEAPLDWCYVNNFHDHRKPIALSFPSGTAYLFRMDIHELIDLLRKMLPALFDSDTYRNEKEQINQRYLNEQAKIFEYLQDEALKHNVSMNTTSSTRVTFVPMIDGKILTPEEFNAIEGEEKEQILNQMAEFEAMVKEALHKVTQLNKAEQKEFKELDQSITSHTVGNILDELRRKYGELPKVVAYLDALQLDIIAHAQDFLAKPDDMAVPPFMQEFYTPSFRRYSVNLFIAHEKDSHAPVIYEDNPIHQNLIGAIEHLSQVGTLVTDFTMIKPGALHKANGGYLVLDARKVLMKPFAWEELKRILRSKEIRIESIAQQYSFVTTTTLEPEPIPINVKVVLVGERILYYLLYEYDPEFKELFKVAADFEDDIPRDAENVQLYARLIGTIAQTSQLLPLSRGAVARVIEESSRNAHHATKLSTHVRSLSDLLKSSDYWARKTKRTLIEKADIETALQSQTDQVDRIQRRLYEQIEEGTLMINTEGEAVGQINALTYLSLGGHQFGMPSRITAQTRVGKGEIIDIERKVELSGPIHAKGIMILSAYLGAKYAKNFPLSLSASLVFEQSYGMIEGDSASSTELYALLSSLSGLPIRQNIAVTGSVNQFGEVQPIGGVNEKIEGFFDICRRLHPDSFHGVIIPRSNVKHLMLKSEIIEAVKANRFAIYPVRSIDEGITILTGVDAGKADEEGNYPEASVNARVIEQLKSYFETVLSYRQHQKKERDEADD